jgi:hypothetical protein
LGWFDAMITDSAIVVAADVVLAVGIGKPDAAPDRSRIENVCCSVFQVS